MTFPVRAAVADAAGLPVLPSLDVKRSAQLVGNAMAMQNVALVVMVAMSCFSQDAPHAPGRL